MAEGPGHSADAARVDPATVHSGAPADTSYSLFAVPALVEVTAEATVRYTLLHESILTTVPRLVAPGSTAGPHGDHYTFYKFADRSILRGGDGVPLRSSDADHLSARDGFFDAPYWDCEWNEEPGRYIVGCRIKSTKRNTTTWCFLSQRVTTPGAILSPMLAEIEQNGFVHPDNALAQQIQYVGDIKADAARMPPATPALVQRHAKQLEEREQYLAALRKKIEPWADRKYMRLNINAMHLAARDQGKRKLNVYIVKVDSQAARNERVERAGGGWRTVHQPPEQRWCIVDWTSPLNTAVCQEAYGSGETDEAAIKDAFASWNSNGNRYETGWIQYSLRFKGLQVAGSFETNGRTTWDTLTIGLNYLSLAAFAVVGVAALVCPVPGAQVVSYAMWTMMVSSTAASTISIAQHMDEGSGTWQDYAIDGLAIVANLLAGAGQAARSGAFAGSTKAWAEASRLSLTEDATGVAFKGRSALQLTEAGSTAAGGVAKATRWILIGQVATDGAQGILVLEKYAREYRGILEDRNLTPNERVDRLLSWIARGVVDGGLCYVAFRGDSKQLADADRTIKHLDGAREGSPLKDLAKDQVVKSPKEKLDDLATKGQAITIKTEVPVEGRLEPPKAGELNVQVEHKTTANTDMPSEPYATPPVPRPSGATTATRPSPKTIALGLSTVRESVTLPDGTKIGGMRDGVLSTFAADVDGKGTKATTWTGFVEVEIPETGLIDMGATIRKAMDEAEVIYFNLDGMLVKSEGLATAAEIAANPDPKLYRPAPATEWELATILSDTKPGGLKSKTRFFNGSGNPVTAP